MHNIRKVCAAAAIAVALATSSATGAVVDAPGLDALGPGDRQAPGAPIVDHRLDEEITVRDWVLCASQPVAESLVRAREKGRAAAERTFADLETARSCGRLAEMQVILQEPLYEAPLGSGGYAGVYSALIEFSGAWASGFVVYGGLPAE